MPKPEVTGQIIVRNKGEAHGDPERELMMVVGIIAVPKGQLKGEHQYTVYGNTDMLHIHPLGTDLTEEILGYDAGALLCSPLWRV